LYEFKLPPPCQDVITIRDPPLPPVFDDTRSPTMRAKHQRSKVQASDSQQKAAADSLMNGSPSKSPVKAPISIFDDFAAFAVRMPEIN